VPGAPAAPLGRRWISSGLTFAQKVLFPAAALIVFVEAARRVLQAEDNQALRDAIMRGNAGWLIALSLILFGIRCLRFHFPLKAVAIDETELYISNYLREISVPLSDVEQVAEGGWFRRGTVTIHLRPQTVFGRRILFWPTVRKSSFWNGLMIGGLFAASHPIVAELRDAANREKRTGPISRANP
jgi:hypothetical protein